MSRPDPLHRCFTFDEPPPLEPQDLPRLLGGKAAGLVRMRALGLPLPPGFVLPTSVCTEVLATG
ncbi:MAG: hypothetical protein OEV40_31485, partial [Acidimicrobiia bacterium]|nr:hypothetical protein [Acidimicrobiia bacterium]